MAQLIWRPQESAGLDLLDQDRRLVVVFERQCQII